MVMEQEFFYFRSILGGGGVEYMKGGGEFDLLMSLFLDSYLINAGLFEDDMIFLKGVAA